MKKYCVRSNNLNVEECFESRDDLLAALVEHIDSHDEAGLSLDVFICDIEDGALGKHYMQC